MQCNMEPLATNLATYRPSKMATGKNPVMPSTPLAGRCRAPMRGLVTIDDSRVVCAFLVNDVATAMSGGTLFVDAGYNFLNQFPIPE